MSSTCAGERTIHVLYSCPSIARRRGGDAHEQSVVSEIGRIENHCLVGPEAEVFLWCYRSRVLNDALEFHAFLPVDRRDLRPAARKQHRVRRQAQALGTGRELKCTSA